MFNLNIEGSSGIFSVNILTRGMFVCVSGLNKRHSLFVVQTYKFSWEIRSCAMNEELFTEEIIYFEMFI